jgi:hypothetical protein
MAGFPYIRVTGRRFAPSGREHMLMNSVPVALTQPLQAADVGFAAPLKVRLPVPADAALDAADAVAD